MEYRFQFSTNVVSFWWTRIEIGKVRSGRSNQTISWDWIVETTGKKSNEPHALHDNALVLEYVLFYFYLCEKWEWVTG